MKFLFLLIDFSKEYKNRDVCLNFHIAWRKKKGKSNPKKRPYKFFSCCCFAIQGGLKQKHWFCLYSWELQAALAHIWKVIFKTKRVQNWSFQANMYSCMDGAYVALFKKREWASAGVEILFTELLPTCLCFPPPIFLPFHGQGSPGTTTELSQDYFCHVKYHLHNV